MKTSRIKNKTSKSNASPSALDALISPTDYQAARANIFPSVGSHAWFMREHRDALVSAGAVVQLAGRLMINGPKFDGAVLVIGQRVAAERSERSGRE